MNIYEEINQKIIEQLDKGIIPWESGIISAGGVISHATGKPYSFLNQMLLGRRPGEYATFNQIRREGGHVNRGEKSSRIVFFKMVSKTIEDDGEEESGESKIFFPVLKNFMVFNLSQCDGVKEKFKKAELPEKAEWDKSEEAEKIIENYATRTNLKIVHEKLECPFYRPSTDSVHIPIDEQFLSTNRYYESVFHELGHSTGAKNRLNRDMSGKFGSKNYAREELVAEICSSYLCGILGFEKEFVNQAAYIQNWKTNLKDDERLMVVAACRAEKACKLILNQLDTEE